MQVLVAILFYCFASCRSTLLEDGREAVEPEYLDYLLKEKKYEEFNRLMGIDVPHLSKPRSENATTDPRFNIHLEHGDILLTPRQKEQARQGINHKIYPTYKWSKEIPYYISTDNYSPSERQFIYNSVQKCSLACQGCVVFRWYKSGDKNYIFITSGSGCYSNLGCIGGQQTVSLDKNGCLSDGTVCHELLHALGFTHEHNRADRDNFIKMNWDNIYEDWKSQFEKVSYPTFCSYGGYDCYSIMHYPPKHPQLCRDGLSAFDVKDPKCDVNRIGNAQNMTETDKEKVFNMYCRNLCWE